MKKHPSSFKLLGELAEKNKLVGNKPTTLYEGKCFTCSFVVLGRNCSINAPLKNYHMVKVKELVRVCKC